MESVLKLGRPSRPGLLAEATSQAASPAPGAAAVRYSLGVGRRRWSGEARRLGAGGSPTEVGASGLAGYWWVQALVPSSRVASSKATRAFRPRGYSKIDFKKIFYIVNFINFNSLS